MSNIPVIDSEGQDEGLLDAQLVSNEDPTVQVRIFDLKDSHFKCVYLLQPVS